MSTPVQEIFDAFSARREALELSVAQLGAELGRYQDGLVLYGAGSSGIALLLALHRAGITPVCFSDGDRNKWGQDCMGLPIVPPHALKERLGPDFLVIVCINTDGKRYCRSFSEELRHGGHGRVHETLRAAGCQHVVDYIALRRCFSLFQGDNTGNLPSCPDISLMLENQDRIAAVYDQLGDALSRETFLEILAFRLLDDSGEVKTLPQEEQYFPADLFIPTEKECFVDCGAFHGQILRELLSRTGGALEAYYALEPDRVNRTALMAYVSQLPEELRQRVTVSDCAAWGSTGTVSLCALGGPGSFLAPYGLKRSPSITIDALLDGRPASAIKMNIEGSELEALAGAQETIRRWRPKLMIAGYHKTWDLWEVPERILVNRQDTKLYLRSYLHHLSFIYYGL